jgi:hypothetical protein
MKVACSAELSVSACYITWCSTLEITCESFMKVTNVVFVRAVSRVKFAVCGLALCSRVVCDSFFDGFFLLNDLVHTVVKQLTARSWTICPFSKISALAWRMFTSHVVVGWVWGSVMVETSLRPQKMYCTHRLFHMTVFLPQSIHLTYEEFLLVSLSFSRNLMHSSSTLAVNDQKWGTWPPARREGSVTTNCS